MTKWQNIASQLTNASPASGWSVVPKLARRCASHAGSGCSLLACVFAESQTTVSRLSTLNTSLPGSRRSEFRAERRTGDIPATDAAPADVQAFGRVTSFNGLKKTGQSAAVVSRLALQNRTTPAVVDCSKRSARDAQLPTSSLFCLPGERRG